MGMTVSTSIGIVGVGARHIKSPLLKGVASGSSGI